jgi:AcrR family transcriptional regulator
MSRKHAHFIPPAPPKTPKATATRARLMGIACELFLDHGYSAVTVQQIADKAGVTKGGLYGHFRSKGQLLVEVIRWQTAQRESTPEFLESVRDPDRAIGLMFDESGRAARLLEIDAASAARHDQDIAAGMAAIDRERQAAVRTALTNVVADPQTMGWLVIALAMGIGMAEAITAKRPELAKLDKALRAWVITVDTSARDPLSPNTTPSG